MYPCYLTTSTGNSMMHGVPNLRPQGSQIEGAIMCFLSCLHFQRLNRHLFVGMFDILLCHVLNPGGGG